MRAACYRLIKPHFPASAAVILTRIQTTCVYSLSDFLRDPIEAQQLKGIPLPADRFSRDQSCLLTFRHVSWSLMCDPQAGVVDWLRSYHGGDQLQVVTYAVSYGLSWWSSRVWFKSFENPLKNSGSNLLSN